jgi:hypothetical protein
MDDGLEACREDLAVPSVNLGGSGRASLGDSGEKEGNEVKDLSEMEDAELDMYEEYFRGLTRTVWDRWLLAEEAERCEAVLCSSELASWSIVMESARRCQYRLSDFSP